MFLANFCFLAKRELAWVESLNELEVGAVDELQVLEDAPMKDPELLEPEVARCFDSE